MHAYRRGLTTHLAGVGARGALLTIRSSRPVADLDARLAAPYFCAVPKDTPALPAGLQGPIPSAGPYYVAGSSGGAFAVLRRNPYYPRPNRAGFDAFVYDFNVDGRRALDMIRHGRADYAAFYGAHPGATLAAQLGPAGDASGIRFRLEARRSSSVTPTPLVTYSSAGPPPCSRRRSHPVHPCQPRGDDVSLARMSRVWSRSSAAPMG